MRLLVFSLAGSQRLLQGLVSRLDLEPGLIERRHFPDGESYVRLRTPVEGRNVAFFCSLDRPDAKALPLLFAAEAARQQGASSVGLIAPYLAYMRQDKAFHSGEAVTSMTFARLLSGHFDWLVTVDPHLHRYPTLASLYSIPAVAVSAAAPIAQWVRDNVVRPFVIGPDSESAQWVEEIAALADAPSTVFRKVRRGDLDVSIEATEVPIPPGAVPVIVDDIASSAKTMVEAVRLVKQKADQAPLCIAVHALFARDAYERLAAVEPALIVSTNSIEHSSNAIDISAPLAAAVLEVLAAGLPADGMKA